MKENDLIKSDYVADFTRIRASLFFDDESHTKSSDGDKAAALNILKQLAVETSNGVTAETSEIFANLVSHLRSLSFSDLKSLFLLTVKPEKK